MSEHPAQHVLDDAAALDAVPTDEIRVASLDEARRWLAYSLFVLEPRGRTLARRADLISARSPWRLIAYRRASRGCRLNGERMAAILAACAPHANP